MELRRATDEDVPALAGMLARSFASCPAWGWMLAPEAKHREHRMERFFGLLLPLYTGGSDGRICLTTADRSGTILLDPPSGWKMGAGATARLMTAMVPVFRLRMTRAARAFGTFDARHPDEPHWYISVLGVDPPARRHGVADVLLTEVMRRGERDRVLVHAETGRPGTRDYYLRNGFDIASETELPGGGPPVWFLGLTPSCG